MARAIPPLNPLHVFEVAARLGNFTKAAEELRVTQSAVSRQIATLESYLNVRLFNRDRSGVSLTKAGKSYHLDIGPAFAAIASSTSRLSVGEGAQSLHLSVYPTFAVKWLIPRISSFNTDYPHIVVRVTTGVGPVAFASENIDLAIQLMADEKAIENSIRLFSDVIQPVCSPALLREGVITTIQDLPRFRLLHSHYRRTDWHDWLLSVGSDAMTDRGIEFPSSVLTYQAASEGLGIAMGQIPLIEQDIQAGKLVPLFGLPLKRAMSYYVVWPKTREPNHKARAFLCWLERQAALAQ